MAENGFLKVSRRGVLAGGVASATVGQASILRAQDTAPGSAAKEAKVPVRLTVNGTPQELELDSRTTLLDTLREYPRLSNSERITFEYVMLKDVNDTDADARRLVKLISGIPAKINLIPFNEWPGAPYQRSDWSRIEAFADIVHKAGYASPIRTPRGEDIMAACGQLKSATERARKSRAQIAAETGL